jgi:glycosyltransferase involved in cell wall biosynthesis
MAGPGEPPPGAAPLGGDGVSWAGWLDPPAKDQLLRRAEIFVISSRSEGMPMALLEAMAYGLAVVATRVGGIPEALDDGVEGILVEAEDPAALAAAIDRLAADPGERARFAAAARARAERLDAVEVAGRLDRIYAALG